MRKAGNGSVQSGLSCANALLARGKARIKPSQTIAMLRRNLPPNNTAGYWLLRAEYKPNHRRGLNTTIQKTGLWEAKEEFRSGLSTIRQSLASFVTRRAGGWPLLASFTRVVFHTVK